MNELEVPIQKLIQAWPICAILCYGSYAEGTQDALSDIDLLVICEQSIPNETIRKSLYQEFGASELLLGKQHDNWDNSWSPINDEFEYLGKRIEIGYNLKSWVNEIVEGVTQHGYTSMPSFLFRPYTFLGLIENSICLFEQNNVIEHIKKQLRPYPEILKQHIIAENLPVLNESVAELKNYLQRTIGILAFEFMLFRGLNAAIQILFALNEVYYPASKREEKHLLSLDKIPPGLHDFIYTDLPAFYTHQQAVISKLQEIQIFINHF